MIKKILLLSLACACSMGYAAKVRMVTLSDHQVAIIKKAHALALKHGADAPLLRHYAQLAAQGVEIERDEFHSLLQEVAQQYQQESKLTI